MDFNVKTCTACDEEIDDDHKGPCPDCGSTSVTVQSGFTGGQTLTLNERGIAMEFDQSDAWQQQWHETRARLKILKEHYEPGNYQGDEQVKRDVKNFFEYCFHVADYIGSDPTNTLTTKQVTDAVLADPDLRICEGIANTSKHSVRKKPEWVTAWVDSVTKRSDESADVVIKWKTDQDSGEEDALELAKRCYTAWRNYHKANGLKTVL